MKLYKDKDGFINDRDIMFAVTSNIISISILSLPRDIAGNTISSDGWITILIGGCLAIVLAWIIAKIASSYPNQSFLTFASSLVSKPIATLLTIIFILQYVVISSFQIRGIATVSQEYLFDRTPLEVVCLAFLLVVIYAVSGSRAAIFRLNIIFFPIIIGGLLLLILVPIGAVKTENLLPVFQTDLTGYMKGTFSSLNAFLGFSIVLFYISLVKNPNKTPKMAVLGVIWPMFFYTILFIVCIGVFGNMTTQNLIFPVFELSKTVSVSGSFFERFDSILFIIWTIIVFTTSLMAFDIAVLLINLIFTKLNKVTIVFILSPIIFFLSMLPKNYIEINEVGKYMSYFNISFFIFVTFLLGIAFKIRDVKSS